ncbi:MAG: TIGR03546 family protein [Elusimicrobiota bacterium]
MNPLAILRSLLLSLQGDEDPRHVAAGFALGAAWGLVPKGNLFSVLFILFFFFFRVDKGMAMLSALFFTAVGYLLDAPAHAIGSSLLHAGALAPLWTWLYGLPIVPWTRFNNTVVLGSLVLGLLFFTPLYFGFQSVLLYYRANYKEQVSRLPFMKAMMGLRIVTLYLSWTKR